MKRGLWIAGAVLVVVIAFLIVAPSFVDWNRYKPTIATQVAQATGRDFSIDGDLDFTILPAPRLSASLVRLANAPGASAPELLRLDRLDLRIALLPLLGGEIKVVSLRLNRPEIRLEVLEDGRGNWELGTPVAAPEDGASETAGAEAAGPAVDVAIDSIVIEDGVLVYTDRKAGLLETVAGIQLELSAGSLEGPLDAAGTFRFHGVPLRAEIEVGDFSSGGPVPVSLTLGPAQLPAALSFTGIADEMSADARLTGQVTVTAKDMDEAATALLPLAGGGATPAGLPRLPLELAGSAEASAKDLTLANMRLKLGANTASGSFRASFDEAVTFEGSLASASLDLDALIASMEPDGPAPEAAGSATDSATPVPAEAEEAGPLIPADITGRFTVSIDAMRLRGGVAQQTALVVRFADGRIVIDEATSLLPSASALAFTAELGGSSAAPRLDGSLTLRAGNLRGLLDWAGIGLDGIPEDRLAALEFTSDIGATPDIVQLSNIDLLFDASRLTGAASYALRARPSFSTDLRIDRINLDAYRTPPAEEEAPTGIAAMMGALALLEDFDTNLKLGVGQLTAGGVVIADTAIDLSLLAGVLTIEKLGARDAAGAEIGLTGRIEDFDSSPDGRLVLDAASADPSGLLELVGGIPGISGPALGPAEIRAVLAGGLEAATIEATGSFAATRLSLAGDLEGPLTTPRGVLRLELSAPGFSGLARQLPLGLEPPAARWDKPVKLDATVEGDLSAAEFSATLAIAGGETTLKGQVADALAAPRGALTLGLNHPEFAGFVRGLGIAYEPARPALGPLALAAQITFDEQSIALPDLTASVGPATMRGALRADLTGVRPLLTGNVETSAINIDDFMPGEGVDRQASAPVDVRTQPAAPEPFERPRWSDDPLPLDILRLADLRLDLRSEGIRFGGLGFGEPRLAVRLNDGRLDFSDLRGQLFGGEVVGNASIAAGDVAALAIDFAISNGDLARALREATGLEPVRGGFSASGRFSAQGASEHALVESLTGAIDLEAKDGVIRGFDLPALSRRLKEVATVPDFLSVIAAGLGGGETRYRGFQARIPVSQGVATTGDLGIAADAAALTLNARLDLPAWEMDAKSRVSLTDFPEAPPFGIDFAGPIDAPRRDVKTRELQAFFASRMARGLLERALGPAPAPAEQGGEEPAPAPATPGGVFRDLLRGLGGGQRQEQQ